MEEKEKEDLKRNSPLNNLLMVTEEDYVNFNSLKRKRNKFPLVKKEINGNKKTKVNKPTNGSIIGVYCEQMEQFWTWMILRTFKSNNYKLMCLYPIGYGHDDWFGHIKIMKLKSYRSFSNDKESKMNIKKSLVDGDWLYEKYINGRLSNKDMKIVIKRVNEKRKKDFIVKILSDLIPEKVIGLK
jgi:hypothetical protein